MVGRTDQITFTDAVLNMFVAPTVVHWPDSANDYTWFADNPSMDCPTIPWDDHFNAQRREVAKDVSSFKTSRGSKRFMRGGVISLVPTSVDDSATVDDIENDEAEAYKESTDTGQHEKLVPLQLSCNCHKAFCTQVGVQRRCAPTFCRPTLTQVKAKNLWRQ